MYFLFMDDVLTLKQQLIQISLTDYLVVTGQEKEDVTVSLSFSVNQSFEWKDDNGNGQLDFYADGVTPAEKIVDMGLRGLIPAWK